MRSRSVLIRYHTLDRGFKEELLKHEMNILDDPILRQPSSKPVKPHADNSHMRSSSINPDSRDFKDDPVPDNEALQGLEEELGIDEASNLAAMTARRRTKEESSIMLNQTLVSANNSSVMDTSLAFNTSVLAFKCIRLLISQTAGANQLQGS